MYAFVVPTFDKPWLSKKCVETLLQAELGDGWFGVVVNDGARPPAPESIRRQFEGNPRLEVILRPRNEGFSKTCNAGIRRAIERGATCVVLVNDDIEFTGPVIPALDRAFSSCPRVGVVGAKLLYPDGSLQHAGMARSGRMIGHRYYQMPGSHPPANEPREGAVTGALMAISASVIAEVGALDEGYFMTCEDTDYCVSAARMGWKVLYWPEFTAIHAEGATRGRTQRQKSEKYRSAEILGYARLYGRWAHEVKEVVKVGPRPSVHWCMDPKNRPLSSLAIQASGSLAARGWDCESWRLTSGASDARTFQSADEMAVALRAHAGVKVSCAPCLSGAVRDSLNEGDRGFALVIEAADAVVPELRPLCAAADTARELGLRGFREPAFVGWGASRALFEAPAGGTKGVLVLDDGDPRQLSSRIHRIAADVERSDHPLPGSTAWVHPNEGRRHLGALAQAMAAGLPIVVADSPETRSVASPSDALFVPWDMIPDALAKLLADPELAARLGASARRAARRHAWHETADFLEEVFDRPDPRPERVESPGAQRSFASLGGGDRAFAAKTPRPPPVPERKRHKSRSMSSLEAKPARGFTSRAKPVKRDP